MEHTSQPTANKPFFSAMHTAILMGLFFILRLLSLGTAPLFDTTETRYANIAQQLILRQDWLVPYMPLVHKPFLGKPPLTFWLIASSYELFGCNDWSSRLPNFLEGMLTVFFTYLIAKHFIKQGTQRLVSVILGSAGLIFVLSATVSMDMLVCLTVTASMWAYLHIQQAKEANNPQKTFLFESMLALICTIGFMNKGPISLILFMMPLAMFALWQRSWKPLQLRWWWVLLVTLGINAPWFIAVQQKHPWFLNYFFINEHLLRYIKPNYGDLYGSGHHFPYGTIWLFLLGGFAPWTPFLVLPFLGKNLSHIQQLWQRIQTNTSPTTKLTICWALFAPLFFTFAKSIVFTYILSSIPALALLCSTLIAHSNTTAITLTPTETSRIHALLRWLPLVLSIGAMGAFGSIFLLPSAANWQATHLWITGITLGVTLCLALFASTLGNNRRPLQLALLALLPVLGITIFYAFFSSTVSYKKTMKPLLVALAKKRPNFPAEPAIFLGDAPAFSWFYYGQEAAVNQKLSSERSGNPSPTIFPEYDITATFPTNANRFKQPTVVLVTKTVEPTLLAHAQTIAFKQQLTLTLLAQEGYYSAYLVQQKPPLR
jgi:4-amino-4-deoxy-L-arabinose transferase-like glycosyltransferase